MRYQILLGQRDVLVTAVTHNNLIKVESIYKTQHLRKVTY